MKQCNEGNLDRLALDYFGHKISYRKMFANIERTVKIFTVCGIKDGDVVTIMSLITPETIYCIYALNVIGAVANMVYIPLSENELQETIRKTNSNSMPVIPKLLCKLKTNRKTGIKTYEEFIREVPTEAVLDETEIGGNKTALIVYTSGTTGEPKGVV